MTPMEISIQMLSIVLDDIDQNCDGADGQFVEEEESEPSSEENDLDSEDVGKEGGCSHISSQHNTLIGMLVVLFMYRRRSM